jgi:hypothetical protein
MVEIQIRIPIITAEAVLLSQYVLLPDANFCIDMKYINYRIESISLTSTNTEQGQKR